MVITRLITIDLGFIIDSLRHSFLVHYHLHHHPLNPRDPCHRHQTQPISLVTFMLVSVVFMVNPLL